MLLIILVSYHKWPVFCLLFYPDIADGSTDHPRLCQALLFKTLPSDCPGAPCSPHSPLSFLKVASLLFSGFSNLLHFVVAHGYPAPVLSPSPWLCLLLSTLFPWLQHQISKTSLDCSLAFHSQTGNSLRHIPSVWNSVDTQHVVSWEFLISDTIHSVFQVRNFSHLTLSSVQSNQSLNSFEFYFIYSKYSYGGSVGSALGIRDSAKSPALLECTV